MDMKIDSDIVKALRSKKLWSQEELAQACGLSLRTVQRVEAEGQASAETIKAIAAVFGVGHDFLRGNADHSLPYFNLQLGYVLICVFIGAEILLTWMLIEGQLSATAFKFAAGLIACICVLFSTMTTQVDQEHLTWHFTLGFFRKTVDLQEIIFSNNVRNKAWWGLGIRLIPNGQLFCVSGLNAVHIRLKNGREYRIGTDDPIELQRAIELARNRFGN